MAMNTWLTSIKIHRQQNDGYTCITHQIILVILMCQETRRIVTKLHLETNLFYLSKSKVGKWSGNELSCPNNRDIRITEFLPPSLSEQEGKSKGIGRGEKR